MEFKFDVNMDNFSRDGYFESPEFETWLTESVRDTIANSIIETYVNKKRRVWSDSDMDSYIKNIVADSIQKTFNNADIINEIKNKVVDTIATKVADKKALAASQFDIKGFENLTPSNKKYLLDLMDEVIAKKFKGI